MKNIKVYLAFLVALVLLISPLFITSFGAYPKPVVPKGMTVRENALKKSRSSNSIPNINFFNCADGNLYWKLATWWLKRTHTSDEMYDKFHYHTCINTVTSFYNPRFTAAVCKNFVANPMKWHFKEVEKSEALPGDIIVLFDNTGNAWHAVILDHISGNDIIINHSNGKWSQNDYKRNDHLSKWKFSYVKFYTYVD